MPTAAVAATVLSTPELLEAILRQLPIHDLLVTAQVINHNFHAAIRSSCALQEALFFRPKSRTRTDSYATNPLLQKKFPPFFDSCSDNNGLDFAGEKDFEKLEWNSSPRKRQAYARKEASWRRMLVAQPPRTALAIMDTSDGMGGVAKRTGRLEVEEGLKMGLLYDLVQASVGIPTTMFAVLWGVDRPEQEQANYGIKTVRLGSDEKYPKDLMESKAGITLDLRNIQQCCVDESRLGPEFRSEGYEDVKIDYSEWEFRDYD